MTSQKSLNKINKNDFKRSFLTAWFFPLIALVVWTITNVSPVFSTLKQPNILKSVFCMFHGEYEMFGMQIMLFGMVVCGMLLAASQFRYLFSKKMVNVYLSVGVSRTRMFLNRILSGSICLFLSSFIPMTMIYIFNIYHFGMHAFTTKLYLFLVAIIFIAGICGFALGAFAAVICGNVVEMGITSFALSLLPYAVYSLWNTMQIVLLTGYAERNDGIRGTKRILLLPWFLGDNMEKDMIAGHPDEFVDLSVLSGPIYKADLGKDLALPEAFSIDAGFLTPMLLWLGISIVLFACGAVLLKHRKAEDTQSVAHFAFSRNIVVVSLMLLADIVVWMTVVTEYDTVKMPLLLGVILLALLNAAIYFLLQLILTRKKTAMKKSVPLFVVCTILLFGAYGVLESDYFGTFNKLPKQEKIEAVSMEATFGHSLFYAPRYRKNTDIMSKDKKDIQLALSILASCGKEKTAPNNQYESYSLYITTKDGKEMKRLFYVKDEVLYRQIIEDVFNSNFMDKILEIALLHPYKEHDTMRPDALGDFAFPPNQGLDGSLAMRHWMLFDETGLAYMTGEDTAEALAEPAFYEALYQDLAPMTFADLYKNTEKPLGVLVEQIEDMEPGYSKKPVQIFYKNSEYSEEPYQENEEDSNIEGTIGIGIPLYSKMQNTIAYLKEQGVPFQKPYEQNIKAMYVADEKASLFDVTQQYMLLHEENYHYYNSAKDYIGDTVSYRKDSTIFYRTTSMMRLSLEDFGHFAEGEIQTKDALLTIYKEGGHPLKAIAPEKFETVFAALPHCFAPYEDNGRYVFIEFEEGGMMEAYLPEASLAVLN